MHDEGSDKGGREQRADAGRWIDGRKRRSSSMVVGVMVWCGRIWWDFFFWISGFWSGVTGAGEHRVNFIMIAN